MRYLALVFVLLLSCTEISSEKAKLNDVFVFNPPNTSVLLNVSVTKILVFPDQNVTDLSLLESRITFVRESSGFRITSVPSKAFITRNGKKLPHPFLEDVLKSALVYGIDNNGFFHNVSGFEVVVERLRRSLPVMVRDAIAVQFSEDFLRKREADDWRGRYEVLIGRNSSVGESWVDSGFYELPDGSMAEFLVNYLVAENVSCFSGDCVKVVFDYSMGGLINRSDFDIKGDGFRVIDPRTMLIYYEQINRIMNVSVHGENFSIIEMRRYIYKYE
jgi:hypothetical protein